MKNRLLPIAVIALCGLFSQSAAAAMYKWVDSKGVVHYSDRLPESSRTNPTRLSNSGVASPTNDGRPAGPTDARLTGQEMEQQKAEAKRQLERQRQDSALLATYTNESEIEAAREREQKRHQETLKLSTSGLAASANPDDKRKLDAALAKGQQDADAINARFDAQKARFRELTAGRLANVNSAKPEPSAPTP